ncbi:MAG TPA: valine--tRNA ligase [Candidatus Binataceae bacterium]|nr:valine--tRNA ligase [Candidatus Binataceae bacterium]
MELSKTYEPKSAEERWYQRWVDLGYFTADPAAPGLAFSIVIPPPNVTGQLHLGHALNVTLQDILVRTRRMQGFNTLWVPGTDHAGIATQNVVERELAREKLSRHQLGRAAFEQRVWAWRATYGGRILHQLRRLGASCDWSRERFTLDEGLSRAVTEVFVRLYQQGLLYRDRRLINWCPRCETALSDLEVEHKEETGALYYIRYPLNSGEGGVVVATTRPETMLGDAAVAVHPDDPRYRELVGRQLRLPLTTRTIALLADATVEQGFGTGAVKITPAHDFNDFELGRRHGLPEIEIMDARARMTAAAGAYAGMSREEARTAVLGDLQALGLLEKQEPHRHAVGHCSRCDTVLEPRLSVQWFVRVAPLAQKALAAVRDGRTKFHPRFWENTYFNWMENVHDWCVSRQLWWGHRIPAYQCRECAELVVAARRPERCAKCGSAELVQEEDVLDTWFSSGLWPFSTLGWPDSTRDLRRYYPTSVLVTGFDIIFFWVARMMMLGLWFTDEVPFRDVYITPLVRDQFGKKMTKSRGNVVDPLEIMETYGTDAVRFTLAQLAVQGRDLVLSNQRLAAARAFANKIWNAARFILMNLPAAPVPLPAVAEDKLSLADRWILSRLRQTTIDVTAAIDGYEFNTAAARLYHFIWHEFCDWYIELVKEPLRQGGLAGEGARYTLVHCCDGLLRLLHPFMPFISEELWQALRPYLEQTALSEHLAVASFPTPEREMLSAAEGLAMANCVQASEAINSLRALAGYHPGQRASVVIVAANAAIAAQVATWRAYAQVMGRAAEIEVVAAGAPREPATLAAALGWAEVRVRTPAEFDLAKARAALQKQQAEVLAHLDQHRARLGNAEFMAKAAPETIEQMEQRAEELSQREQALAAQLQMLVQE